LQVWAILGDAMGNRQGLQRVVAGIRGGAASFLKLVILFYCAALAAAALVGGGLIIRWIFGALRSIVV